jgi:hypothetical protein
MASGRCAAHLDWAPVIFTLDPQGSKWLARVINCRRIQLTRKSSHTTSRRNVQGSIPRLQWFAQPHTVANVVDRAALAEDHRNKRLSHQRRLPQNTIPIARRRLAQSVGILRGAHLFSELIDRVGHALRGVRGAGTLYIYDTALRIGYARNVLPDHVYLHAGARKGARTLLGGRLPRFLPLSAFPPPFRRLQPHELENLLCRYAECL